MKTNLRVYDKLELVQGSEEWLATRRNYITASNVPCLFGQSPYKTALQYFEELTSGVEKPISKTKQTLFDVGHKAESLGRDYIQKQLGLEMSAAVVVSRKCPDLLASLDGFNEEQGFIFEAKYMGAEALLGMKLEKKISAHHESQVQAQMLATGANKCVFFGVDPKGNAAVLDILPNPDYQSDISEAVTQFMKDVREGKAPEPSMRDFIELNDPRFADLANLKIQMDQASALFDQLKSALIEQYKEHARIRSHGLTVTRSLRKGNVQYDKVPQLKGVDLEKYRTKPIETVTVRLEKKGRINGNK